MKLSLKNNEMEPEAKKEQGGNPLFPVFLKLNHLHTVLIGAGNVGHEKLKAILNNSPEAKVTVIAQTFLPEICSIAVEYQGVITRKKSFEASDLDDADLVVAATNDQELNSYIRESAHERRLLINVADKPDLCDFYLGSIVQKGDLKIAISTNGKSPTVAKRLKEVLSEALPAEIDTSLQQLSQLRDSLNGDFAEKVKTLSEITAVLIDNKGIQNKSSAS